jgi:hypothetical protein
VLKQQSIAIKSIRYDSGKKYTKNHLPLLQNVNKNKNKTTGKIINVHKYISLVFSLNLRLFEINNDFIMSE